MRPDKNGHSAAANGAPQPFLVSAAAEPAAPPPELRTADVGLAEVLSPSQCATLLECPAKFWFRYGLAMAQTQGAALGLGKAVHAVVRDNFLQKIETKTDLPLAGVLALYETAWTQEASATEFQPDEDRDQVKKMGRACLIKYHETIAPLIEPAKVELPVAGIIGGVRVRGFVDVLDVHGRIIDLKSAKTSPSKGVIRPDYRFQIATYEAITPGASGKARLDTVVKLQREVKTVTQSFDVTEADRKHVRVMYPLLQATARSGLYPPARHSLLCSRRYCSYVDACIGEFGGTVRGEAE